MSVPGMTNADHIEKHFKAFSSSVVLMLSTFTSLSRERRKAFQGNVLQTHSLPISNLLKTSE